MPYYVYLLANPRRTVLYTGVTRDLCRRVEEHRAKAVPGFTARYNVTDLLYYEPFQDVHEAIRREKHIKAGSRADKLCLIGAANPTLQDLSPHLPVP